MSSTERMFNGNILKAIVLRRCVLFEYSKMICIDKVMASTHQLVQEHKSKAQNRGHGSTHCCHCLSPQTFE